MYSFLVLGIVPGTNLQITFRMWLDSLALLFVGVCLWYLASQHETLSLTISRQPLHASQLHLRAL